MPVQTITTPTGEELVVLSRDEYDDLVDARDHAAALRDVEAGRMATLSDAELDLYLAAPTPLAFWRQRSGLDAATLAVTAGITDEQLAQLEAGSGQADVGSYAAMARLLRVQIEDSDPAGRDMKAVVTIMLKPGVLDPQGRAIGQALAGLGFAGVGEVRAGKVIELDLAATDSEAARAQADDMARKLLANPVIESYSIALR